MVRGVYAVSVIRDRTIGSAVACVIRFFMCQDRQLYENYRLKNTDGVSVQFLLLWIFGDIFNLLGVILEDLLVTMVIWTMHTHTHTHTKDIHTHTTMIRSSYLWQPITFWPIVYWWDKFSIIDSFLKDIVTMAHLLPATRPRIFFPSRSKMWMRKHSRNVPTSCLSVRKRSFEYSSCQVWCSWHSHWVFRLGTFLLHLTILWISANGMLLLSSSVMQALFSIVHLVFPKSCKIFERRVLKVSACGCLSLVSRAISLIAL